MDEFFRRLFDTTGFTPRASCGLWNDELIWLHVGSDLFIWLAYVSIPLVLLWFGRRWNLAPVRGLLLLFAAFILSCGFTHLFDALLFTTPVYRAAGLLKLLTAVVSWVAVLVLIAQVPRLVALVEAGSSALPQRELLVVPRSRGLDYAVAASAAVVAILIRLALDPLLGTKHPQLLPTLAIIFAAWVGGYGPALFALGISFVGLLYFFISPRGSFVPTQLPDQVGVALFFFCGVACAMLGASERLSRFRAAWALEDALRQRDELVAEIERRREAEKNLRTREEELLQANDRHAEALALYRTLTEAVPQIVWTTDLAGHITYANRRWGEYTGVQLESATSFGGTGRIHPDDVARAEAIWAGGLHDQPDTFTCELRFRRADGVYRWFLAAVVPLRTAGGTVLQWVGTLTDINDQKDQADTLEGLVAARTIALRQEIEVRSRAEERLRATDAELRRSNAELEAFAYVASHDLQEPLRKIQAFGDRLAQKAGDQLTAQCRDYLDRILSSATRMRRLIEDLLTFSRVTSRAQPFAPVDLNVTLREVLLDLDDLIEQTGAQLDAATLPTLDADPSQMRQLFQNLLGNALKFTKPGIPPRVRFATEEAPPGHVRVVVSDDGIGFEPRYAERIFQVFQRLHGRAEYEGTGVGLAICKKIVERHGGTILARSQPGQGATFVLEFPVQQPRAEEPPS